MEVAALALLQANSQNTMAVAMIKQKAQAEQAIVDLVSQAVLSGGRGQSLNLTV